MPHLALVHTAELNVATFTNLMNELAPDIPVRHVLACHLLEQAIREGGVSDELTAQVRSKLLEAAGDGAPLVMLTCSTVGGGAEALRDSSQAVFLRVDRPMAGRAVEIGSNILVAACLQTTVKPTTDLIAAVAAEKGREVRIRVALFPDAWAILQAGDPAGYVRAVAEGLHSESGGAEVIVLAQASMAKAAPLCAGLGIPILSSPRLGAEAAIAAWRRLQLAV
jgi:hypothetical protein